MADPARLFRAEALRSRAEDLGHDEPAGSGALDPVSPRWTTRAYRVLLVLVAVGLAGSVQVRVREVAQGPATVRGRMMIAVLPAVFASRIRPGLPLTLTLPGRAPVIIAVSGSGAELTGARAASTLLGLSVAPDRLPPGTLLVVRAVAPEMAGQHAGTASVQVGSQRLITTLVTGLAPGSEAADG